MGGVSDDVTEPILERLAGERKADGDCIAVNQRFDGLWSLFQYNFAKGERKARNLRTVWSQIREQLFGRGRGMEGRVSRITREVGSSSVP